MKFRKLGQMLLASAVSTGFMLGITSCANDFTVGYIYVLGTQPAGGLGGEIGQYKEDNNNGILSGIKNAPPIGSGGTNPIRAIIPSGSRFMYVLNNGVKAVDSSGNITYTGSGISVFSIGGYGQLSFQQSYSSQGLGPIRIAVDASNTHLFVLDSYAPIGNSAGTVQTVSNTQSSSFPCQNSSGQYNPTGDVTVFGIDNSTGRLSLVTNQQQQNLTYFPVGCNPVDFGIGSGYLYAADAGATSNSDAQTVFVYALSATTGQLTQTQNAPQQTGAQGISSISISKSGAYIYLLDAVANQILPFTSGTSGALTAVIGGATPNTSAAGNPQQLISVTGSPNNFVYVANAGPAGGTNVGNSDISGYVVNTTTGLLQQPADGSPYDTSSESGLVCIFEDPSNQYIYAAGAATNSITGRKLDPQTGNLSPLNKADTFPVVNTPSWCLGTTSTR